MPARSKARKRALDILYEADLRGVAAAEVLRERVARADPPVPDYTAALVDGVSASRDRIDAIVAEHAVGWTLERMPPVDRNVLRLGVYELLWVAEVPDGVAISEAVTLARSLSSEESPRFVNGLLAKVAEVRPSVVEPGSGSVGERAPGVGGEHAPGDQLLGELAGGRVVDDSE